MFLLTTILNECVYYLRFTFYFTYVYSMGNTLALSCRILLKICLWQKSIELSKHDNTTIKQNYFTSAKFCETLVFYLRRKFAIESSQPTNRQLSCDFDSQLIFLFLFWYQQSYQTKREYANFLLCVI